MFVSTEKSKIVIRIQEIVVVIFILKVMFLASEYFPYIIKDSFDHTPYTVVSYNQ